MYIACYNKNLGDNTMCNLPQEIGLYWAKRDCDSDWLYVALIRGVKPFLTYNLWNTEYPDNEHSSYDRTNLKNLVFSDRIQLTFENTTLNSKTVKCSHGDVVGFKIQKNQNLVKITIPIYVEKPGLYVVKARKDKLAYIKGEAPYFTCWIWETTNNQKYKHLMPEDLLFVEYIEKPE
jgi:hypothetical protein